MTAMHENNDLAIPRSLVTIAPESDTDDLEMELIAGIVRDHAGIVRPRHGIHALRRAVSTRMFRRGTTTVRDYRMLLDNSRDKDELGELVELLTVQKTSFFRDRPQFDLLECTVLPGIIQLVQQDTEPVRIWSAGCSTGEEPYSIAMVLRRLLPHERSVVLATDISVQALEQARGARYNRADCASLTPSERSWFTVDQEQWSLRDEIRAAVEFDFHNLVTVPLPERGGLWHAIFCRNVLIYFNRETVLEIVRRFYDALIPGGYLFLGVSESLFQLTEEFELETSGEAFVYRKPLDGAAPRKEILDHPRPRQARRPPAVRPPIPPPRQLPPAVDRNRPTGLDRVLRDARHKLACGDRAGAFKMLFDLTTRYPHATEPHMILGRVSADEGKLEEALSWYQAATEIQPLEIEPRFLLAVLLHRTGRDQEAANELRKLLFLDGGFSPGHFYLGIVASDLGDIDTALRSFRNVLRIDTLDPGGASARVLRGHNLTMDGLVSASRARLERLGHTSGIKERGEP